jgi:RNA polymerase sigma factor for flagellar operon FliA
MIQIPLEYDDDEQLMDWPSSERSQLDVAIENENKRRLRVAMESLSPRERAVIELYYGPEELRMSQVAEIIGVHESRVSQINVIALIKLRKKLVTRHGSLDPSLREE